jgi:hypothetical protein
LAAVRRFSGTHIEPFGINLEWTNNPVYEWRIFRADGEKGKPIPTDSPVAIANDKVEPEADFLIYFDRPVGADVGWTTSPTFWDTVLDEAGKKAVAAAKEKIKE